MSNTSLTPELVTLTTELANAFAQSRKVVSARARIGLFYQNPEATDLFRKVNEYCIAPPEVGNYWQVGEEDGLPEGGAGRYASRVAAGCFPGVL